MYMLGGYVAYYLFGQFGLNFFATLVAAGVIVGGLGVLLEKFIFRPLATRPNIELTSLIACCWFGLGDANACGYCVWGVG